MLHIPPPCSPHSLRLSSLLFQSCGHPSLHSLGRAEGRKNTRGQTSTRQRTFWDFVAMSQIYVDLIAPLFLQAAALMHLQGKTLVFLKGELKRKEPLHLNAPSFIMCNLDQRFLRLVAVVSRQHVCCWPDLESS